MIKCSADEKVKLAAKLVEINVLTKYLECVDLKVLGASKNTGLLLL